MINEVFVNQILESSGIFRKIEGVVEFLEKKKKKAAIFR